MTITYDGYGNAFLGDGLYGNHSLNYGNNNYFQAYDIYSYGVTQLNADLSAMMTTLNIPHTINSTFGGGIWRINWSSPNDLTAPAAGRFSVRLNITDGYGGAAVRDDAGSFVGSDSDYGFTYGNLTNSDVFFRPQLIVNLSVDNFSLFITNNTTTSSKVSTFLHTSYLKNVNNSYGLYTTPQINSCFACKKSQSDVWTGYHHISPSRKNILTTGEANYPIICSDSQTPSYDWLTDWYVFDNNPSLGNPGIGRVPNMLVSNDTTMITGKPVKLTGTVKPDMGNNRWLPVGYWMGKTIFMRIYSSYMGL